jgi:DNA-binding CsgD family transcriptional regulator
VVGESRPAGGLVALSKRETELLLFDQIFAAATRGDGAVLLVTGAVGTGKTALLQEMAARAGRRGGWCFLVTASCGERDRPLGVVDRLIQSMCAAGMADPFPRGSDADEDLFAMMDRVLAAIRGFAGGSPVVVGIDDLHFADSQSLRCLNYLIWRIESSGVVMVLNESSSYERHLADLRAEMLHLPFCRRVRLVPLAPADIAQQVRERTGARPDDAFVRFGAEVTGGVPLLLHALLDDQTVVRGPAGGGPAVAFRQAVLRSLHRCVPSTARTAQAMAILGAYATPALVAELACLDTTLVEEGIRDLEEMGLTVAQRFRHPHTRSSVLASIPLPDLPRMHRRAAELLHESGAPATAVADHLIATQGGGRVPWRVTIFNEAAREAMAAGDVESAVNILRHAVGASTDERHRAQTGVRAAEAQWHADPSRAARRLGELTRNAAAGLLTGADMLVVVNQLLWWGEFGPADELLRLGDPAHGESSLAQLWRLYCRDGLGSASRGDHGPPAGAPPAPSGPLAAATHLSSAASMTSDDAEAERADQMLLEIRAGTPLTPALYALVLLVQTDRLDEASGWCDRLLKEDWIARVPMRRVMIAVIRSVAAMRAGDSGAALRGIREVFDVVRPQAWGVVAGLPLSVALQAAVDLGDAQSAQTYFTVPVRPGMLDTPFAVPYLQALGSYHRAMGHPRIAMTHVRSCLELLTRWNVDPFGMLTEIEPPTGAAAPLLQSDDSWPAAPDPAPDHDVPRPAEGAALTDAEQRVAALAAAGHTNRQIAEHLFITVSTVEQHLTKIYRKLKVRSRSGLRRHLH